MQKIFCVLTARVFLPNDSRMKGANATSRTGGKWIVNVMLIIVRETRIMIDRQPVTGKWFVLLSLYLACKFSIFLD